MDFFFGGSGDFEGGQNQFQFLNEDALYFEELRIVLRAEFFGARQIEEVVELFPALEIIFHLLNQVVQFFIAHRMVVRVRWPARRVL